MRTDASRGPRKAERAVVCYRLEFRMPAR